jgi:hypothetical protein
MTKTTIIYLEMQLHQPHTIAISDHVPAAAVVCTNNNNNELAWQRHNSGPDEQIEVKEKKTLGDISIFHIKCANLKINKIKLSPINKILIKTKN